jgi:hypothetical protein
MSDEEIKNYIALYYDFVNDNEYDNVCNFIKQLGTTKEAVKQGLLNYIDKRINDYKEFEKVDMKDFMFEHKQRSKNAIIELVELKKSIQ